MSMPPCIGKSYGEIWELYKQAHLSRENPEHELRRIHLKWKRIRAEIDPTYRKGK